ncbi:MAG: DNA topoisomerase IB [Flavobacteriaceae bacterium]|nr:DNA topoisomerase IB [Flavobacteriaceae bacterium]
MYFRKKQGKGFSYFDENKNRIKQKEQIDYFKSLVIPPAWTKVEIAEKKNAKILATGYDTKGRKQYIYNPKFRQKQDEKKFDRIISFAEKLEHMRRVTGQHLRKKNPSREKVMACMVRLLETAFFRPGSEVYSKENESYGLTTLRSKHLEINGNEIIFSYKGKSGIEQKKQIIDARLAKIVKEVDELPGYEIFKYWNEDGNLVDVKSEDLNQYIREIMGEEYSAKDFRTWSGTMIAAIALDELGAEEEITQQELNKNIRKAVVAVSEKLGNTPAVARSSYIDPRIIDQYIDGKTLRYFQKEVNRLLKTHQNLSSHEIALLCLLRNRLNK